MITLKFNLTLGGEPFFSEAGGVHSDTATPLQFSPAAAPCYCHCYRRRRQSMDESCLPCSCGQHTTLSVTHTFLTDSMTSPRARHTPTCPAESPLRRPHGPSPDIGRERGSRARELQKERKNAMCL